MNILPKDTDGLCEHGDDLLLCPPCNRFQPASCAAPVARTIASHDGLCLRCDRSISKGDPIVKDADDEPWTHEDCR